MDVCIMDPRSNFVDFESGGGGQDDNKRPFPTRFKVFVSVAAGEHPTVNSREARGVVQSHKKSSVSARHGPTVELGESRGNYDHQI